MGSPQPSHTGGVIGRIEPQQASHTGPDDGRERGAAAGASGGEKDGEDSVEGRARGARQVAQKGTGSAFPHSRSRP